MRKPVLVTGHGRSGTHWLAATLRHFVDARHEPAHLGGDVVVDCTLHRQLPALAKEHEVVHLVRDGREVVRSTFEFYGGRYEFSTVCEGWATVLEMCRGLRTVRLEDLLKPAAASVGHRLSHWTDWPPELTDTFWATCGEHMRHHGYVRDQSRERR